MTRPSKATTRTHAVRTARAASKPKDFASSGNSQPLNKPRPKLRPASRKTQTVPSPENERDDTFDVAVALSMMGSGKGMPNC